MTTFTYDQAHLLVPPDPAANVRYRRDLLREVRSEGPDAREAMRAACRADPVFWVNTFVWQINPNPLTAIEEEGPFVLWERQVEMVRWVMDRIERRRDGVVVKSRELGASWIFILVMDWYCRFRENKHFLLISRDEDSVDDGTPHSLFGKLQYLADHVPDWLSPAPERRQLKWQYGPTGGWIVGRASTGSAGVGGRATAILFDEFSRFGAGKKLAAHEVLRATADVSKCRLFNSTHFEPDTAFDQLCRREDVGKFEIHWSHHPEKRRGLYRSFEGGYELLDKEYRATVELGEGRFYDFPANYPFVTDGRPFGGMQPGLRSPWYDAECVRRDSRAVSIDLDADVKGAVRQFFDAQVIQRLKLFDCKEPLWEGEVHLDHDEGEVTQLVRGRGGPLWLWCVLDIHARPPRGVYVVSADIAWGTGGTPSVLSVWDATTGVQVAEYASAWVKPEDLGALAVGVCRLFHGAFLIWETSGPGGTFRDKVLGLGYQYVFYHIDETKNPPQRSDKPGWASKGPSKAKVLSRFSEALAKGHVQPRSKLMCDDCLMFKHDGKGGVVHPRQANVDDPSGAGEGHADRGMAGALAVRGMDEVGGLSWQGKPAEPEPDITSMAGRILASARGNMLREFWY